MQRYNPEVKPMTNLQNVDPRVADLVDKLRHVHHMAMSSIGSSGTEVDYMQRDGVDGSGSGNGADIDDNEEEYNTRGSGSGNGALNEDGTGNPNIDALPPVGKGASGNGNMPPNKTGGSSSTKSSMLISFALLVLARLY
ncbi:Glypican domain containing protein, partial [Asbolus verrucosus]